MRAQVRAVAGGQAERVLQLTADRQHRLRHRPRQRHRPRHPAPRAAEQRRLAGDHPRHRVVAAGRDVAVVHQERVGDAAQPGQRVVELGADRRVGAVARRHHQRPVDRRHQQVVQRRVRQHQPKPVGVGRDLERDAAGHAGAPVDQHDRPLGRGQERGLVGVDVGQRPRRGQAAHHDRERLVVAVLARAQQRDDVAAPRVAREVEATQALDRDDRPGRQPRRRDRQRLTGGDRLAVGLEQRQPRSAHRTGVGLRVEPPVTDVVVFTLARRAHRERRHRRRRAVVGDAGGDREARAAGGAVGERVVVAPVVRIADLAGAVDARREVGRDRQRARAAGFAALDHEVGDRLGGDRRGGQLAHVRRRRRLAQPGHQRGERRRAAERLDGHAAGVVAHAPADADLVRDAVHPRAETHALHRAAHLDPQAASLGPGIEDCSATGPLQLRVQGRARHRRVSSPRG